MTRESIKSIKAAMAPAKRKKPEDEFNTHSDIESGDTTEPLGFGIPVSNDSDVEIVPLFVINSNGETVSNLKCLAKRLSVIVDNKIQRYKFYLKIGMDGYVYDPWGTFSEGNLHKNVRTHGKLAWDWSEVNENAFSLYLKYLKTRNRVFYVNVDREIKNA